MLKIPQIKIASSLKHLKILHSSKYEMWVKNKAKNEKVYVDCYKKTINWVMIQFNIIVMI